MLKRNFFKRFSEELKGLRVIGPALIFYGPIIIGMYLLFLILWPIRRQVQRSQIFPSLALDYQRLFPIKEVSKPVFVEQIDVSKVGETYKFKLINQYPDLCRFWRKAGDNQTIEDYREIFRVVLEMVFYMDEKVIYKRRTDFSFARPVGSKKLLYNCRIPYHLPLHVPIDFSVTIIESDTSRARGPFYLVIYNSAEDVKGEPYSRLDGDPID